METQLRYPINSDLSGEQHYSPLEQLWPDVLFILQKPLNTQTTPIHALKSQMMMLPVYGKLDLFQPVA